MDAAPAARLSKEPAACDVLRLLSALSEAYAAPAFQAQLRGAKQRSANQLAYLAEVERSAARAEGPIFRHAGLPDPPKGNAAVRRLSLEHAGNAEILRLSKQCRDLLGVERGFTWAAVPDYVDIPFFEQSESGNCVQACLKMALKWYFPDREYSFDELDQLTGRSEEKWTWSSQAAVALVLEGLDAHLVSAGPFREILEQGEPFVARHYGTEMAEAFRKYTDYPALYRSIRMLVDLGRYQQRKQSFEEVQNAFLRGEVALLPVDYSKIWYLCYPSPPVAIGSYSGHSIILSGVGPAHTQFHDPLGLPDRIVDTTQFVRAWEAMGADSEAIFIRGKLDRAAQGVVRAMERRMA